MLHNISGNPLNQVNKFKYLGTILKSERKSQTEITGRIGQAKTALLKMNNILAYTEVCQWKLENEF